MSRMLPTVLVGALGAAALYFMFRVFEGGLEYRPFFFLGLVIVVAGGVGPVQLGLIFTMHSVERRFARRRFAQRICVWCTYALEGATEDDEIDAAESEQESAQEEPANAASTPVSPTDEVCPECGNEVRRSLADFERISNRRLVGAAVVSVVSIIMGCAAAEAWLVADNAAFRSEVTEFVATGNADSDYKRPRRWPNGWAWLVYDHETEEIRSSFGR